MILFVSSKGAQYAAKDLKAKNTLKKTIMKKLTNVSPFLLLLVPVFIMVLLTLTKSNGTQQDEMAKASTTKGTLIQVSNPLSKSL